MDKLRVRKPSHKLIPICPLSPRPLLQPALISPRIESRPRTSSLQRTADSNVANRDTNTLPPEINTKKEFIIKSSKDRRTPEKRRTTPNRKQLQSLFKKIDEEEEKDFLDLIQNLK